MKKGNITITQIIIGALVVLLLFILGACWIGGSCQEQINRFKILIPGFNFTTEEINQTQIIGYNIAQDKAKFYDGISWHDFTQNLEYKDKKQISADKVRESFVRYYYTRELPYNIELQEKTNFKIGSKTRMYDKVNIESLNIPNQVIIYAKYRDYNLDPPLTEQYFILINNKLYEGKKVAESQLEGVAFGSPLYTEKELAQIHVYNDALALVSYSLRTHLQSLDKTKIMKDVIGSLEDENGAIKKDYELKTLQQKIEGAQYQFYFKGIPLDIYLKIEENVMLGSEITTVYTILARSISNELIKEFDWLQIDKPEFEIIQKVSAWRDSILTSPILFKYDNDNNDYYFCVRKTEIPNSIILSIDLSKPKNKNDACIQS